MAKIVAVTKEQVFVNAVKAGIPGAKAWYEVRGYMDPVPRFYVCFRSGMEFEGEDSEKVLREAWTYMATTYKLTGEYP